MAKSKTVFFCQDYGYQSPKWMGKCPGCSEWNTLVEETLTPTNPDANANRWIAGGLETTVARPTPLSEIDVSSEPRTKTGSSEFDRVLGGGLVQGSVILIGGDPGIGKSTLILQSLHHIALGRGKVLYVSGEESPTQIKLRADRLKIDVVKYKGHRS